MTSRNDIEKQMSSKPLNADADEDDYDFPVPGGESEGATTENEGEESVQGEESDHSKNEE